MVILETLGEAAKAYNHNLMVWKNDRNSSWFFVSEKLTQADNVEVKLDESCTIVDVVKGFLLVWDSEENCSKGFLTL